MENKEQNEEQEFIIEQEPQAPAKPSRLNQRIEDILDNNKKPLIYGGIAILAVLAGFFAYKTFIVQPKEKEAQASIFMAQKFFEMDSLNLALQGGRAGNTSFTGLIDIADEYSGTATGNLANYYIGISYLKLGKYEEAIEHLKDFDANDQMVSCIAMGGIGDAYVELGDLDEAVKYYKKAASRNENKFLSPIYYKKAGLAYENLKEYSEAVRVYKKIKEDFSESQEARDIEKYIARAEALEKNN